MDRLPSPARKNLLFGNSCSSPSGARALLGFLILLCSSFAAEGPVKADLVLVSCELSMSEHGSGLAGW